MQQPSEFTGAFDQSKLGSLLDCLWKVIFSAFDYGSSSSHQTAPRSSFQLTTSSLVSSLLQKLYW